MIYCHDVTKRFGECVALENVSFEVAGGICALIGPNGAGKSTLLKILTGQLRPDNGDIRIAGSRLGEEALEAKRIMGALPEDLGLFNHLTVKEHLELTGPVYGLSKKQTHARIEPILRLLGIGDARNTFVEKCSHGTRKKTALAVALLPSVRLLLLDEPFEGIDPVASKVIAAVLAALAQRGIVVLFTSHTLSMVDRLASQIVLIRNGRIVHNSATQPLPRPLEDLFCVSHSNAGDSRAEISVSAFCKWSWGLYSESRSINGDRISLCRVCSIPSLPIFLAGATGTGWIKSDCRSATLGLECFLRISPLRWYPKTRCPPLM